MTQVYLVRIGVLGVIGRFQAVDWTRFRRGARVICRTRRGLESGEVLGPATQVVGEVDGELVRGVTIQDDLLLSRLQKNRDQAYDRCTKLLRDRGMSAVLMEVEQLFDGSSLYFYFLGETNPQLEQLTGELAETYETAVEFRKFATTVEEGCGPGCGTEEAANGCGSECATCAILGACGGRASSP